MRAGALAQGDAQAYLALAEDTGLTAEDCRALATMMVASERIEDALSWVERGLDLAKKAKRSGMVEHDLPRLRLDLLMRLGRDEEALASAWEAFRQHPSKYAYDELMKYVPEPERPAWHDKAIEAASGADLHSLMGLLTETGELARLATLVREADDDALAGVSHHVTEPAAKKLEDSHPDIAARLWSAQGMRLVQGRKSKYYDAGLRYFERARRCFEKAGLAAEWQRLVERVRAEHRRKLGFMAGFEEVVAGSGPGQKPSFLERAKARWGRGGGRGGRVIGAATETAAATGTGSATVSGAAAAAVAVTIEPHPQPVPVSVVLQRSRDHRRRSTPFKFEASGYPRQESHPDQYSPDLRSHPP